MKNRSAIPVLFTVILIFSGTAESQVDPFQFIRSQTLRTSIHYKSWSFSEESGVDRFTQFAFPISYSLPVGERLALDLITSPFMSRMAPVAGEDYKYDNLSDSYLRASYILGDNLALVTLGAGLPSGNTDLSDEELVLAGVSASRALENPVTSFGTGLNLNLGLAVARELGGWVLGLGAGYAVRGKYDATFVGQSYEIDPGDEFNITLGADRAFEWGGRRSKFIADFIYSNYGEDELEGLPFFEAGDKFLLRGQLIVPLAFFDPLIFTVSNRWRLDNRSNNSALVDNGDELDLRATMYHPLRDKIRLKYLLEMKKYSNTVNDTEGADIFGFGVGVVYSFSRTLSFDPTLIYSTGSIHLGPESDVDVSALEVTGGLSFRF